MRNAQSGLAGHFLSSHCGRVLGKLSESNALQFRGFTALGLRTVYAVSSKRETLCDGCNCRHFFKKYIIHLSLSLYYLIDNILI